MSNEWEIVIGLEIHAQLATASKIFSGASTKYGAEPNTQASLVDLGYPGVLPVLNSEAVKMAIMFGLAINADIASHSIFARKNYFYPDLPKGYQISQYELPIVHDGELFIRGDNGKNKRIGITRAHLEEDAGKSIHEGFGNLTGIDLNRAGTPLLEIVSEPDISSSTEAVNYMKKIHAIVRYLEISDGNMQEGSFRCDANVSLRKKTQKELGTRTELKNLNSFRFVEKAINYEIERQSDVLEQGRKIIQETRLYDSDLDETRSMRNKEEANDYRYFPDPDLLPIEINKDYISELAKNLPELPDSKQKRFLAEYQIKNSDIEILISNRYLADFFEQVTKTTNSNPQTVSNWVIGDLSAVLNRDGLDISMTKVSAQALSDLLDRIQDNTISGKIAKEVFNVMWSEGRAPEEIISSQGLVQITDDAEIESVVDVVIKSNPSQFGEYCAGKEKLLGFFVGQVMKKTDGKANPTQVNEILKRKLKLRNT